MTINLVDLYGWATEQIKLTEKNKKESSNDQEWWCEHGKALAYIEVQTQILRMQQAWKRIAMEPPGL